MNELAGDGSELGADFQALKNDLVDLKAQVADLVEDAKHTVIAGADQVAQTVKQSGEVSIEAAEAKVREHPIQSLLLAFGVGCIVGRVLRGAI